MKILNKYDIFKECGFGDVTHDCWGMPDIGFNGYDKVMDYCYDVGYVAGQVSIAKTKYSRSFDVVVAELATQVKDLETAINSSDKTINALHKALVEDGEVIENLQSLLDDARAEIIELRKHNGDLANSVAGTLETSPKSKFVITVEEF